MTTRETTEQQGERVRELERRIELLEASEESVFGGFTRWDWGLCVTIAMIVPLLLVWQCAG